MSSSNIPTWLVSNLETATNKAYNKKRAELYAAVNDSKWDAVFSILNDAETSFGESWINQLSPGGWAPLHYAAYEGQSTAVVEGLLQMGALRTYWILLYFDDSISDCVVGRLYPHHLHQWNDPSSTWDDTIWYCKRYESNSSLQCPQACLRIWYFQRGYRVYRDSISQIHLFRDELVWWRPYTLAKVERVKRRRWMGILPSATRS